MYGHFLMFYIRQFYFILFILPPAACMLIWGNIIVPLICIKHTLHSYVFWLLLINFTLAKCWPAHSGCSHLVPSLSCRTDSLQVGELEWEPQQRTRGKVTAETTTRSPLWNSQDPDTGWQGCALRQLLALICTFSFSPGGITGAWGILWEHQTSLPFNQVHVQTAVIPLQVEFQVECSHLSQY